MKKILIFVSLVSIAISSYSQSAEIHGIVTDVSNNEPVPFANIIVYGTQVGSTSDLEGDFVIKGLSPGYYRLQVSYIGYKTDLTADVFTSYSNIPFLEIKLEPSQQEISEVEVTVDPFKKKPESPLSMQSIGVKEIESNPGSNRDISRVIQSFPGVGSTPAYRNDIIIRGGGPAENRFFLDDVEIPVLNHFSTQGASGGPVGIINADFIQTVDFYSGSFPANKYNALSGMFDFKLKEGSRDKVNLQAALGASEASFTVDGPSGKNSSYIFSVRRSYLQFLFAAIGLPFLPTFNDYQFKYKANLNKKNQLTIISLGSLDQLSLNTGITDPDASQQYILSQIPVNNQWSYTFGTVFKHFVESGYHTFVFSRNMLNNEFYKYPDNNESLPKSFDYSSNETENKIRYELSQRKNGFKYIIGLNMEFAKYYNNTSRQIYNNNSLSLFEYTTSLDMFKYGVSAQAIKGFYDESLQISLGLRTDGNSYNSEMSNLISQLSPRISLSYSLTDYVTVNAGTGRYFQQPAYTTLGFRNSEGNLVNSETAEYIGVNHYNFGFDYRISKSVIITAEAFYKDYFQYPIDVYTGVSLANQGADYSSVAGATSVDFSGDGKATGFELLGRVNLDEFSLLASYTFVRSLFTDISGEYIPSSWDSKNILTITGSKDFAKNIRAGFKWRFVGGLPYTPYDLTTSANIEAWNAIGQPYLDYSNLNSLRFKPFHQLDIRIDKNFFYDKWALMLYVDIQNAYNFKNTNQDYIVRATNTDGSFMTTNGGNDYVLNSVLNESGTLLPTVGVMIKF